MNEEAMIERLAASRMQVAALHTALRRSRAALDDRDNLPEDLAEAIDQALSFCEVDGFAVFLNLRTLLAAAADPQRSREVPELASRIERLIGARDCPM